MIQLSKIRMSGGTKTLLFGVHNIILHPFFVTLAWLVLYKKLPNLAEFVAIITHDWGLWGMPDVDGDKAEEHPEIMYTWWIKHGEFGKKVATLIIGHSRFYAIKHNTELSKLFYADKLCIALYPKILYLILGTLSGEINEYMGLTRGGKYSNVNANSRLSWLLETTAHMTLHAFGKKNSLERE